MSELREGDIESLRSSRALEGKPIRSDLIRDKGKLIHYTTENDHVRIKSVDDQD